MVRAKAVVDQDKKFYGIRINCPGCALRGWPAHVVCVEWQPEGAEVSPGVGNRPRWTFNGDFERPTLGPSLLLQSRQWDGDASDGTPRWKQYVCHSFIKDGRIQFLGDCTHALAGQTVDLLPATLDSVD